MKNESVEKRTKIRSDHRLAVCLIILFVFGAAYFGSQSSPVISFILLAISLITLVLTFLPRYIIILDDCLVIYDILGNETKCYYWKDVIDFKTIRIDDFSRIMRQFRFLGIFAALFMRQNQEALRIVFSEDEELVLLERRTQDYVSVCMRIRENIDNVQARPAQKSSEENNT